MCCLRMMQLHSVFLDVRSGFLITIDWTIERSGVQPKNVSRGRVPWGQLRA